MLLALLILIGAVVAILLIVWLTNRIFASQAAIPVVMEEIGTGDGAVGGSMELDTPEMDETDFEELEPQETLATVADAVASKAAMLHGGSGGKGTGSGRAGKKGKPRRWEVRFTKGNTVKGYAQQLDFFGIELGVLLPGGKIAYASNLAKSKPDRREGPAEAENRYYLTWRQGDLVEADRTLLSRAGIEVGNRIILKFLPPKLEAHLVSLERSHAGRDAGSIFKTRFGIRPDGGGFAFYVMDQTYKR